MNGRLGVEEREAQIVARVQESGFVSITHLAEALAVSEMTIRRDVRKLTDLGEVRTVHGGVSLAHGTLKTATFAGRAGEESEAKKLIAEAALSLLGPSETIAIDSGTTCFALAAALDRQFDGAVITHSIPVLQQMLNFPRAAVIGLGGELMSESQVLIGANTTAAAGALSIETFFLGANSLDERGIYLRSNRERPVKEALIRSSIRVVLLADASKLAHTAPVRLCGLEALHTIVTSGRVSATVREACRSHGVGLLEV